MKYWEENEASEYHPGWVSLKDHTKAASVLDIFIRDGMVIFEDGVDRYFRIVMPPEAAIEALGEVIEWIKERQE